MSAAIPGGAAPKKIIPSSVNKRRLHAVLERPNPRVVLLVSYVKIGVALMFDGVHRLVFPIVGPNSAGQLFADCYRGFPFRLAHDSANLAHVVRQLNQKMAMRG